MWNQNILVARIKIEFTLDLGGNQGETAKRTTATIYTELPKLARQFAQQQIIR